MSTPRVSLEQLRVEHPCPASWDAMTGNDRVRFCEACQKRVYDLSAMPKDEAERLICEAAGRMCVRIAVPMPPVAVGYQGSMRLRPRRGWRFWTGIGVIGAGFSAMANVWYGRPPVAVPTPAATRPAAPVYLLGDICPPTSPTQPANPSKG